MPAEAADALGASALERVAQLLQHGVELHVGSGHVIRRSHWRGRRRATGLVDHRNSLRVAVTEIAKLNKLNCILFNTNTHTHNRSSGARLYVSIQRPLWDPARCSLLCVCDSRNRLSEQTGTHARGPGLPRAHSYSSIVTCTLTLHTHTGSTSDKVADSCTHSERVIGPRWTKLAKQTKRHSPMRRGERRGHSVREPGDGRELSRAGAVSSETATSKRLLLSYRRTLNATDTDTDDRTGVTVTLTTRLRGARGR